MAFNELDLMTDMTPEQRTLFQMQYNGVKKSGTVGVLLALLLGGLGAHHFYMGRIGLGVVYVLLCWTLLPSIAAFIEMFLMTGRVDSYNSQKAAEIAMHVRAAIPAPAQVAIA